MCSWSCSRWLSRGHWQHGAWHMRRPRLWWPASSSSLPSFSSSSLAWSAVFSTRVSLNQLSSQGGVGCGGGGGEGGRGWSEVIGIDIIGILLYLVRASGQKRNICCVKSSLLWLLSVMLWDVPTGIIRQSVSAKYIFTHKMMWSCVSFISDQFKYSCILNITTVIIFFEVVILHDCALSRSNNSNKSNTNNITFSAPISKCDISELRICHRHGWWCVSALTCTWRVGTWMSVTTDSFLLPLSDRGPG